VAPAEVSPAPKTAVAISMNGRCWGAESERHTLNTSAQSPSESPSNPTSSGLVSNSCSCCSMASTASTLVCPRSTSASPSATRPGGGGWAWSPLKHSGRVHACAAR
jgi:hypothetical protein